jgi:hypothetical protein
MPEMKRNFTKGKMNKDLDERLVPPGEYRDAMNIQVSTSEDSDVGTIQNVLGNTPGCSVNIAPPNSYTVGSVSDEKNDTLYWLVSGQETFEPEMSDMILRRRPSVFGEDGSHTCEAVFVDKYAFTVANPGINSIVNEITVPNAVQLLSQLQAGWTVTGVDTANNTFSNVTTINSVTSDNYITFDWNFTTINTPSYQTSCVGSSVFCNYDDVWVSCSQGSGVNAGLWVIPATFTVYLQAPVNDFPLPNLVGSWLDIDTYNNPQLFGVSANTYGYEIISQGTPTIIDAASGFGVPLEQLTLDSYLTIDPSIAGFGGVTPEWIDTNGKGYVKVNGADLTTQVSANSIVPDDGFITLPPSYDYTNYTIGDQITLNPNTPWVFEGCVNAIDAANNYIQVVDCNDNTIFATPPILINNQYETTGSIIENDAITIEFGGADLDLTGSYDSIIFQGPRVLNFDHGDLILGINIIDEFLFWTDNKTEPKKISIPRSIAGTDPLGNTHTDLILPDKSGNLGTWTFHPPGINRGPIREEHITVIKKAPHRPPSLKIGTSLREGPIGEGYTLEMINQVDVNGLQTGIYNYISAVGETLYVKIADQDGGPCDFVVGDVVGLADGSLTPDPFANGYQVRFKILEINEGPWLNAGGVYSVNAGETAYLIEIVSFADSAPTTQQEWVFELVDDEKFLFERKLPRFAYRYKYVDNEYSTYGPFSDVAFYPGQFEYQPVKAYNEGMTNRVRRLTLQDFVPSDIPEDVVQIDILYKNENSSLVYLMDSIKENDANVGGTNAWNSPGSAIYTGASKGSYDVTTENIYTALPANQTIRTWDNVPTQALAQDISGNRIIYGNYKQGYTVEETLNDSSGKLVPNINVAVTPRPSLEDAIGAQKSIKSLRDYDIGVVWGDEYGRETPVITPSSGSFIVPKTEAENYNYLKVDLDKSPYWADYYRFYIKETSNEYYNLAVDRIYDAEDGNIWVSFPSVDRNKVDEDTYIILKKGSDSDVLISEKARYKIVAIENEAPEYIKTNFEELSRTNTDATRVENSCIMWGGVQDVAGNGNLGCPIYPNAQGVVSPPVVGRKSFSIDKTRWNGDWSSVPPFQMGLPDIEKIFEDINADNTSDEFYVSFTKETIVGGDLNVIAGSKYRVMEVITHTGITINGPNLPTDVYEIKLSEPIKSTDDFVVADYNNFGTYGLKLDNIHVIFWKRTIRNKPEFDGRFFVKIYSDINDRENLSKTPANIRNWVTAATAQLYLIDDSANLTDTTLDNFDYSATPGTVALGSTHSKTQWETYLKFGGNALTSKWFIDKASFAGQQPLGSNNYAAVGTSFIHPNTTTFDSCDVTTNQPFNAFCPNCLGGLGISVPGPTFLTQAGTFITYDEDVGDGSSYGQVGMKGAFVDGGLSKYIDISFARIRPEGDKGRTTDYSLDWRVGDPGNTDHDEELDVVQGFSANRRFKFAGGDIIYKVLGVTKFRLFNYQGKKTADFASTTLLAGGGTYWHTEHEVQTTLMATSTNRRHTYRIRYEIDFDATDTSVLSNYDPNAKTSTDTIDLDGQYPSGTENLVINNSPSPSEIQFLEEFDVTGENKISTNPAIFETEPKEDADLDLYYEASSSFPTFPITNKNISIYLPIGTTIMVPDSLSSIIPSGIFVGGYETIIPGSTTIDIILSTPLTVSQFSQFDAAVEVITFLRDDGTYVTATLQSGPMLGPNIYALRIIPKTEVGLSWHNCWSFGNGVESNRIGDTYNKPYLSNGVAVSSIIEDNYKQEHKKYSLIYSGIYNSNSGINSLNQFIAGEKITKDINPSYGSIQRLKAGWGQSGDLIALCEDRVLKILANKDALFNADGNSNVTATDKVLGQAIPYSGEYGISTNPESFASEAYRAYFTDKVRGSVMRLSMDGLTPISEFGMKDWFRDNLKLNSKIVGSYDDKKDEYNISLENTTELIGKSVTFKENVKGWVSFKSFVTQNGISCANDYFTFKGGELFMHHHDVPGNRNTFYGVYNTSSFEVILNDAPGIVKSFYTLNYEGTQSKVDQLVIDPATGLSDGEYYNLNLKKGWYVDNVETNKEKGSLNEFIEKEGKWFNYIRGENIFLNPDSSIHLENDGYSTWDQDSFAIQGLGALNGAPSPATVLGCTDPTATNYNCATGNTPPCFDSPNLDDGSCYYTNPIPGCTTPGGTASNYNPLANVDDGSCTWYGCTDPTATNYASTYGGTFPAEAVAYNVNYPGAIIDDNSCVYPVFGCTDPTMFNYDPTATDDDGSCVAVVNGCLGQNNILATQATNYNVPPGVNTDDGSCEWSFCSNPLDANYNALAVTESVAYFPQNGVISNDCASGGCTDPTADNYNVDANGDAINPLGNIIEYDDGSCFISGCTWNGNLYDFAAWSAAVPNANGNYPSGDSYHDVYLSNTPQQAAGNYNPNANQEDGSCIFGAVINGCTDSTSPNYNPLANNDDGSCCYNSCVYGCMDPTAYNYDPTADIDDGSCWYTLGCTDPTAFNYDPAAAMDDGSCITSCQPYTIDSSTSIDPTSVGANDGQFELCFSAPAGWDDNDLSNTFTWDVVDVNALSIPGIVSNEGNWVNTGCITFFMFEAGYYGLTLSDAYGCPIVDPNIVFQITDPPVYGCTDPNDYYYNVLATADDGTCSACTLDLNTYPINDWLINSATLGNYNATSIAVEYPANSGIYYENVFYNNIFNMPERAYSPGTYGSMWLPCDPPTTPSCSSSDYVGGWNAGIQMTYVTGDVVQGSDGYYYKATYDLTGADNPDNFYFNPAVPDTVNGAGGSPWVLCQTYN